MPRMPYRVGALFHACATGRLAYEAGHAGFDEGAAVTVVLASDGYPGPFPTGLPIDGVDEAGSMEGVTVFHAGTARDRDGRLVTAERPGPGGDGVGGHARAGPRPCLRGRGAHLLRGDALPLGHRGRGARGSRPMSDPTPLVGVLAASPSELPIMRQAGLILEKFAVPHEVRIMSSSRNPDLADEYARTAFERGLKVVICSTGLSGHLAAAVAARTVLPVIGVPIASAPQMVGQRGPRDHRPDADRRADRHGRGGRQRERGHPRVPDPRAWPTRRSRRPSGSSRTTWRRASGSDGELPALP